MRLPEHLHPAASKHVLENEESKFLQLLAENSRVCADWKTLYEKKISDAIFNIPRSVVAVSSLFAAEGIAVEALNQSESQKSKAAKVIFERAVGESARSELSAKHRLAIGCYCIGGGHFKPCIY